MLNATTVKGLKAHLHYNDKHNTPADDIILGFFFLSASLSVTLNAELDNK